MAMAYSLNTVLELSSLLGLSMGVLPSVMIIILNMDASESVHG